MAVTTFAIAHGAADVGWSWHLVVAELERLGHKAVAPDLPCEDDSATFSDYADTLVTAVGEADDVVVVGHSLGGFTATLAAERLGARMLVFVSAMVPRFGESADEWWEASGYTDVPPFEGDEVALYLADVEPELAAEALRRSRGQSGRPMGVPWPLEDRPAAETRYIALSDDRFFPAGFTRAMARERLGIEADEMPGSHCVYLSRPAELAERLVGYAK